MFANGVPYNPTSSASEAAAETMLEIAGPIRRRVYLWHLRNPDATAEECNAALELSQNTGGPRRRSLYVDGWLIKSEVRPDGWCAVMVPADATHIKAGPTPCAITRRRDDVPHEAIPEFARATYAYAKRFGYDGVTNDQVDAALGIPDTAQLRTKRAYRWLAENGFAERTELTQRTRSGRLAGVWRIVK